MPPLLLSAGSMAKIWPNWRRLLVGNRSLVLHERRAPRGMHRDVDCLPIRRGSVCSAKQVHMIAIALFFALNGAPTSPPAPAPPPSPAPCSSVAGFHALDFWVGSWRVTAQGQYAGTDVVAPILDNCAIVEKWTDADGSHGMSLFYYNTFAQSWSQVWVTDLATARGGLKEKFLIARFPDGGVRFQGALPGAPGSAIILDRTTLTPDKDGSVHQLIEISRDGGSTWSATFDAIYAREHE